MAKNKKRRKSKTSKNQTSTTSQYGEVPRNYKPIIFFLIFFLILGGIFVYNLSFDPPPPGSEQSNAAADKYGRPPGDAHYGHDHP